jgi:hypothetical protein
LIGRQVLTIAVILLDTENIQEETQQIRFPRLIAESSNSAQMYHRLENVNEFSAFDCLMIVNAKSIG